MELAVRHADKLLMEEFQAIHLKYKSYELEPEGCEEDKGIIILKFSNELKIVFFIILSSYFKLYTLFKNIMLYFTP